MKTEILALVEGFLLDIAEMYEPHMAATLPDTDFDALVNNILEVKDKLVSDLVDLTTIEAVEEEAENTPEPVKDLWSGSVDLPRDIGSVEETLSSEDLKEMSTLSAKALSSEAPSAYVDVLGEGVDGGDYKHDLGLSVAEESRIAQGLPPKRVAPKIAVNHEGVAVVSPSIKRPVPKALQSNKPKKAVEVEPPMINRNIALRIRDICVPHLQSPDKVTNKIVSSVLAIVADADSSGEEYDGRRKLWDSLQEVFSILRKIQRNLGKYSTLPSLQKDLSAVITDVLEKAASAPVPKPKKTKKPKKTDKKETAPEEDITQENPTEPGETPVEEESKDG